jgi:hypothetical protein
MTANGFRRIVLGMSGAIEGSHMGHPDFRVNGRIFASLQSGDRAMVMLTPDQQEQFVLSAPEVFAPESGAWGRQGCTRVYLKQADAELIGEVVTLARQNRAAQPAKKPRMRVETPRTRATKRKPAAKVRH